MFQRPGSQRPCERALLGFAQKVVIPALMASSSPARLIRPLGISKIQGVPLLSATSMSEIPGFIVFQWPQVPLEAVHSSCPHRGGIDYYLSFVQSGTSRGVTVTPSRLVTKMTFHSSFELSTPFPCQMDVEHEPSMQWTQPRFLYGWHLPEAVPSGGINLKL